MKMSLEGNNDSNLWSYFDILSSSRNNPF
ncbi:unnamed protein product [Spirodela intermedia]|uniref:Uncharacterized protein n=1 Tax=Spirodela intermedia TaxID=51605 RepID=A0A7I8JBL6_SPIIN|nr:unnamed protein product [Spirodela intermedia]CAA6666863.1 unnamed protein product [Spirodela intermedia]